MKISFCITTTYDEEALKRLPQIYDTIRELNIPDDSREIIVIGGRHMENETDVRHIYFDDNQRPGQWLTRKKNILAQEAKFDILVQMHDYFLFHPDWYKNFLEFGDNWDLCSNRMEYFTGERHTADWTLDAPSTYGPIPYGPEYMPIDYNDWTKTRGQYQTGGYMLVKRKFILDHPWDEELWGVGGEDREWSRKIRDFAVWKCNGKSIVRHNKIHWSYEPGFQRGI